MKHNNCVVLFTFFSMMTACATVAEQDEDGGGSDYTCYGNVDFFNDFMNCGGCGQDPVLGAQYRCNPTTTDVCKTGQCICSGVNYECFDGYQECKLGVCAQPDTDSVEDDPEAINCEWDHQCHGTRMCVLSVCSEVPCADNNGEPQIRSCYSGFGNTYENPPCHKGYTICFGGRWNPCQEEALPEDENGIRGCNGIDDDCDGCPDGKWLNGVCVVREINKIDVNIIFDRSPSMESTCEAAKLGIQGACQTLDQNPNTLFSGIQMPYNQSCDLGIFQDFSTYADFEPDLLNITCANGGSNEPSWDAVRYAAENTSMYNMDTGEFGTLSWRDDAIHVIIMITDEPGQSWNQGGFDHCRAGLNDESTMCSVIDNEILVVFTLEHLYRDFDECAETFPIRNYNISVEEAAQEIQTNIESVLGDICH